MVETASLVVGLEPNPKNFFECDVVDGMGTQHNLGDNVKYSDLSTDIILANCKFFACVTAHNFLENIPRIIYATQ